MIALSISISSQLVGSLLIFVLVTLPAASAKYYAKTTLQLMGMAIVFALFGTWIGLTIAYLTNLPTSFYSYYRSNNLSCFNMAIQTKCLVSEQLENKNGIISRKY